jgi:hypothetical protein
MIVPKDLAKRNIALISYMIIHHSVGSKTLDILDVAAEEMDSQHFLTIGYNAYIKKKADGTWIIQEGRPLDATPAAALDMNTISYDICIAGNYQPNVKGVPTDTLEWGLIEPILIQRIKDVKAKCPNLKHLIGHRDVSKIMSDPSVSTACPGDILYSKLSELRSKVGLS